MLKSANNLNLLRKRVSEISLKTDGSSGVSLPKNTNAVNALQLDLFEVNRSSAKDLDLIFQNVLERFRINDEIARLFISPDQNIQGTCVLISRDSAAIVLSAGAINMLTSAEIEFLLGHELAHLIKLDGADLDVSPKQRRYAEVDADRVGLFACESLDIALSALTKTATGLTNRHFQISVGDFLEQGGKELLPLQGAEHLTHPPAVIRARALARFGAQVHHKSLWEPVDKAAVSRVNEMVESDLTVALDFKAFEERREAVEDLKIWERAQQLLGNKPNSGDWNLFQSEFGENLTRKMRNFYMNHKESEIKNAVSTSIARAKKKLEQYEY